MTVEFVKNPTGLFNLSYNPGDVIEFDNEFAKTLIETGYAVQAKKTFIFPDDLASSPETTESKATPEKAVLKSGKKK